MILAGVLLFKYREQAAYFIRQKNSFFDSSKDSTGEGALLILPAIFAPVIGIVFIGYAGHHTFGW